MIMHIKNILNVPNSSETFAFVMPEEQLAVIRDFEFATPVQITGKVANRAGVVTLTMQIAFSLLVTCDRCLKQTVQAFSYDAEHLVVRFLHGEEDEENYVIAKADSIDIAEIALSDLILELPTKLLCSEDCKGLCPQCGCDRNLTECNCMNKIIFD
ncbi:MAG: DUF177 domain-containing protein [Oscillospiraceae bacterium]|nr:DUF177 domain-containing protein [Ruminococcus sp.]MDE6707235.1 DUF177 domain-containing protein [Oscillospiraceae bacterium]